MKFLLEVLNLSADFLKQKSVANSLREAQDLMCDVLHLKRTDLYLNYDRPLTEEELQRLRKVLVRRAKGEPSAYIHGKVDFLNCTLHVTPAVLIPRQETEILTAKIIEVLEKEELEGKSLWDVCCGSGCIGIALKKRFPHLRVILSDMSSHALEIAQKNAKDNEVNVDFLEGDLLLPFKGKKAHFLVCNPPYISEKEFVLLESEVKNYEPRCALVGGASGFEYYEKFRENLADYLHHQAKVWFEIGTGQGTTLRTLFQGKPWKRCEVEFDWSNHDRFFFLEIE